jgi:hypothetical protein
MNRSSAVLLAAFTMLATTAPRAHAQIKLEGTAFFTSYYATNYTTYTNSGSFERQEAGPGLGAALAWRFNNIWAVEGQGVYVHTGVVAKNPGFVNFQPPTDGYLLLANARLLFQPRRTNIYFAVGAGSVSRRGEAWNVTGLDKTTDIEGIVGFGVRARVNPQWGFKLGVEAHLYKSDPDGASTYYQSRLQDDIYVTIGVPFALIGK